MSRSYLRLVCVLGLACLIASCAHVRDRPEETTFKNPELVHVATIPGDPAVSSRVFDLLDRQGVSSFIVGSVGYAIWVRDSHRKKAVEILKADSAKQGYWIEFK